MRAGTRRWISAGIPLALAAAVAAGLAVLGQEVGEVGHPEDSVGRAVQPRDAGPEPIADTPSDAGPPPDAAYRVDRHGRLARAPDAPIQCVHPDVDIPQEPGCAAGHPYPRCRWQLPDPQETSPWVIWRNTTPEHRWGRPGLVSLILASAHEYARRWPGEHLTVGDLDAPGPRHQTHDRGVDVDLYLEEAMIARSIGGGRYPDNYEGRSPSEVHSLRARVIDLAKILATCTNGQLRIYYNDPDAIRPFREWFDAQGLHSDIGPPMRMHNDLHRFHFHLTVAEDTAPLARRDDG